MNIERARLPWQRRYNWRLWFHQHRRCLYLFVIAVTIAIGWHIGEFITDLYLQKLEAEYQKVSVVGQCWAKEMYGAPVTAEDATLVAEPVGFRVAYNWKKLGWRE